MKVYFRCKQSGNLVSFTDENDIEVMRKEEYYEEVKDAIQERAATEMGAHNEGNAGARWEEEGGRVGQRVKRSKTPKEEKEVILI